MSDAIARMALSRNDLFDDGQAVGAAPQDDNTDKHFDQGLHNANFLGSEEQDTHKMSMTALS